MIGRTFWQLPGGETRRAATRGPLVSRRAALAGLMAMTAATLGIGQGWPARGWPTALGAPLRVRKNAQSLTASEKERFVGALKALKQKPSSWSGDVSVYDEFVRWHGTAFLGDVMPGHLAPAFFPWHRMLNHLFEQELQKIDPAVTIPYWDWATDRTTDAAIWQADFLGGDGDADDGYIVKTGAVPPGRVGDHDLRRGGLIPRAAPDPGVRHGQTGARAADCRRRGRAAGHPAVRRSALERRGPPDTSVRRFAEDGHGCPRSKRKPQAAPTLTPQSSEPPETLNKVSRPPEPAVTARTARRARRGVCERPRHAQSGSPLGGREVRRSGEPGRRADGAGRGAERPGLLAAARQHRSAVGGVAAAARAGLRAEAEVRGGTTWTTRCRHSTRSGSR